MKKKKYDITISAEMTQSQFDDLQFRLDANIRQMEGVLDIQICGYADEDDNPKEQNER